ncbi:ABC transporter substrate-binding protein [Jiangella alba]|uniref:ABC-type glycerol-3-phosphate transport system, substrate-binding protein n=1 Tax=Jiangella alba TaxID=561176 RepID=A0A1H5MXZ6_9ACTN|nr:ABC transporter substrate-binding protein [Jiangella alba]SEE94153.1 ABC-type glycerol-3-phosphate transport system, substrate-binding protein [Jiangella alba]
MNASKLPHGVGAIMSRRTLLGGATAIAGLGALSLLPGCSSTTSKAKGNLDIWTNHSDEEAAAIQGIIDEFTQANTDIRVNLLNVGDATQYYTKINTSAVGRSLPDVFYVRTFDVASLAAKGFQVSIQDLADQNAEAVDVPDLWPAQVEQMSLDGEIFALPYDFSNNAIYINKTMFEEEGIPLPTGEWDWTEFWDTAAQFARTTNGTQDRWGASYYFSSWVWIGFLASNGGRMFSDDLASCVVNSPENIETFELFQAQLQNGAAPAPGATPEGVDSFGAGLVAMTVNGSFAVPYIRGVVADKFEFDVVRMPTGSTGRRDVATAGGAWAMSSSANQEAAFALMTHLSSEQALNTLIAEPTRSIPGRQSSAEEWTSVATSSGLPPANIEVFAEQMNTDALNQAYPKFWTEFETAWNNRTAGIANGDSVPEALAALEEEVNQAAARYA